MKRVFQAMFCAFLAFVIAIAIISVIEVGKINNDGNIIKEPWVNSFPREENGVTWTRKNGVISAKGSATTYSTFYLVEEITIKAPQRIYFSIKSKNKQVVMQVQGDIALVIENGEEKYVDVYEDKIILRIFMTFRPAEIIDDTDIIPEVKILYPKKFNYMEKVFNYIGSLSNLQNYWEYMRQPIESIANSFLALQNGINWSNALTAVAQAFRALLLPIELGLRSILWLMQLVYYTFSIIWV